MKMKNITIAVLCLAFVGCTFVGNSPEERKHRETFQGPDPTSQIIEVANPNPSDANPTNLVDFRLKTDAENSEPLSQLAKTIHNRDGTNFIGQYLGMIAEWDGSTSVYKPKVDAKGSPIFGETGTMVPNMKPQGVMMFSATSGELLRWISYEEFRQVYVLKTRPEYPQPK
jgi:hypothetical protein